MRAALLHPVRIAIDAALHSTIAQPMSSKPIRTHYDNLQVARNASDAVIRAAFKSLAQNYHPDRATGDVEEAARAMQIINVSYKVLSDPDSRQEHDQWIAEMEEKNRVQALPPAIEQMQSAPIAAPAAAAPNPIRVGIKTHYDSPRSAPTLFSRMFGWLFVGLIAVSLIPFAAQVLYWFRFKAWVALPARLAFGHGANLPESIGIVMPSNSVLPPFTEWLYHPAGMLSIHQAVYSLLDSLNISFFYVLSIILIFYIIQFIKDRI